MMQVTIASNTVLLFMFLLGFLTSSEAFSLVGETFDEWIMGCKALTHTGDEMVYYISGGNIGNSTFVYIEAGDSYEELLFLPYNHYYNVSVAGIREDEENTDDEDNDIDDDQTSENLQHSGRRFLEDDVED